MGLRGAGGGERGGHGYAEDRQGRKGPAKGVVHGGSSLGLVHGGGGRTDPGAGQTRPEAERGTTRETTR
ncbi:hypothetical protein GCM10009665_52580 [Kitasatospora nipponensis]|uniref:Uncharacterized protein n=1 Tax=Kitasatospora nipponensis TaxID=258049 RepID=A0ABN1WPN0_9ACTN